VGVKPVLTIVLAAGLIGACFSLPTTASPEPALVSKSWEFKVSFSTPKAIAVRNLQGEYEWFWYMAYKVVNNSGQERLFIPDITIASDQGDIMPAGKNVRTAVFDDIKKHLGNKLLDSPTSVVGQLLQGEDNAKESVAIWPASKHNIDRISIFFAGLSGETIVVTAPDPADTSKTLETLVTKTLMIDYELPGFPISPQDQTVQYKGQKWIMR